jgi:hypothetical protein
VATHSKASHDHAADKVPSHGSHAGRSGPRRRCRTVGS